MRTTLTLEDDAAAALERLRKSRKASLKDLINDALRRGLKYMSKRTARHERFRTQSVALSQLRIAGLDNIGEALAIAEGQALIDANIRIYAHVSSFAQHSIARDATGSISN
jgi:hypothetical protein